MNVAGATEVEVVELVVVSWVELSVVSTRTVITVGAWVSSDLSPRMSDTKPTTAVPTVAMATTVFAKGLFRSLMSNER